MLIAEHNVEYFYIYGQVSDIDAKSALIQIGPPEWNSQEFSIKASDFTYELLLSEKGREGKYKAVYT